jgi:hypothetical protein
MFPGRFIAGVGHGNQRWMAQAGVRVESPLTLLREYVTALRAAARRGTDRVRPLPDPAAFARFIAEDVRPLVR